MYAIEFGSIEMATGFWSESCDNAPESSTLELGGEVCSSVIVPPALWVTNIAELVLLSYPTVHTSPVMVLYARPRTEYVVLG